MDKQKSKQLSQLIDCSNAMLRCAENDDWNDVIEAEILRDDLIKALFSTPSVAQDLNEITDAIREIQGINEMLKVHALCMMHRVDNGTKPMYQWY